ncbi:adenine deaminase [bacterium]|nr:adenine deaminase [bacterium]
MERSKLQKLLAVARGDEPADLLLINGKIVNTLSYEIIEGSVALFNGYIVGVGDYEARAQVDLHGAYLSPALIDGHIHIESSLLAPPEFARTVVPWGTGAVVCDPHEIANVCGTRGIQYMLDASERLPLDVYVMLPSCVPATHMETAGADLTPDDLRPFLSHPRVLGVAEVMNFPGVVLGIDPVLDKVDLAAGRPVDGHAPGVRGKWLNAYSAAGIQTDHESTELEEGHEKLRNGMKVFIREGSTARNLEALLPLVTPENCHRFSFVSDDRHADELQAIGHMNATVRKAVKLGLDPVIALAMASTHTAEHYGLHDTGAIAPGRRANLVLFEDLKEFKPLKVWRNGVIAAENGKLIASIEDYSTAGVTDTVRIGALNEQSFAVAATGDKVNIIEVIPDQIVTRRVEAALPQEAGCWIADTARDIAKMVVIERHGRNGNIGRGFVKGLGLTKGALASTVAHDSHNLICAGTNDRDMLCAANALKASGGGWVVVAGGKILAQVALPVAGLMSNDSASSVIAQISRLHQAARQIGCPLDAPFMALSFLALPVIPSLKLTDHGLVDVDKFMEIELGIS